MAEEIFYSSAYHVPRHHITMTYAADGGLYAEMLENRSYEFVKAVGDACDYQVEYDGGYAWSTYPAESGGSTRCIPGSPHSEENPHYMRLQTRAAGEGIQNKAFVAASVFWRIAN